MRCHKVVAVCVKTIPRILAARRTGPRYAIKKIVTGIKVVAKSDGYVDPVIISMVALL
jgi:hypothetical protein